MHKVVSISFEGNSKKYYFAAIDGLHLKDIVVVETIRGLELGKVVEEEKEITDEEVIGELKSVIRLASESDIKTNEENNALKVDIIPKVKEASSKYNLDMKIVDAEYTLDRSKLIIYFTSEGRVDFRELVKDLAAIYKTRIELRQIGPRDASRITSGIGPCGRKLCCSSFLGEIKNVTIKMAKNQNLALNPTTISGLCGKLLCCISFEDQVYSKIRENLPDVGDKIETEKGDATVTQVNVLDESVNVEYEDKTVEVISLSDLTVEDGQD